MTLLTPLAALVALAALLPLAAALRGRGRVGAVRRVLGLQAAGHALRLRPARPRRRGDRPVSASPPRSRCSSAGRAERVRKDAQALFVLDTSRSMAASSTATSPTRLDRARAAAVQLRASIPQVPSGRRHAHRPRAAGPAPGRRHRQLRRRRQRAVAIESPPPRDESVRATTYAALARHRLGQLLQARRRHDGSSCC